MIPIQSTIKEWLEDLPEPYKTLALNNTSKSILHVTTYSLLQSLKFAFSWENSPEGYWYWYNFSLTIK